MSDGVYQVKWPDLDASSAAALGHAKFTQGMIEELHGQAQQLSQLYSGNASLSFITEQLAHAKKIAQNSVDAHTATHQAHQEASMIASSTEAKNVSIVSGG